MKKQIIYLQKTIFLCFSFFIITNCSSLFENSLLEPTLSFTSQWAKNVSGKTYIDIDGAYIKFDVKGNIEKRNYQTNSTLTTAGINIVNVSRTYKLEVALNAHTAIFAIDEVVENSQATRYYIGCMVDNGAILYRTAKVKNSVDLIDLESIGRDKLENLSDLKSLTINELENAKLRSMHMTAHKVKLQKMQDIKMTDSSWTSLKNKLFVGEFTITIAMTNTDGSPMPDPADDNKEITNQLINNYKTFVYLRAGDTGRMDVKYLVKTNNDGILEKNVELSDVTADADDYTKNPFVNNNYTNTVTVDSSSDNSKLKNYLSTNHSMAYTTKDGYTTFITCIATLIYNTNNIELEYEGYKYNYHKLQIIDANTIKLIDATYFVDIPISRITPYYGLPKDIVLSNVSIFNPTTTR